MLREFIDVLRRRVLGLAGGLIVVGLCGVCLAAAINPEVGRFVWTAVPPPVALTPFVTPEGAPKTLADFRGKTLVVNFWATWCEPCEREMPTLDKLQTKMGGDDFQVLAVSQDREGASIAQPFLVKHGWKNVTSLMDPSHQFSKDAKVFSIPFTLVIDKTGREIARIDGEADWVSHRVLAEMRKAKAK